MRGKMIFFNEADDYGFIRTEEDERLLVRRGAYVGDAPVGRCAGLDVEFSIVEVDGEREAFAVVLVPEEAQRRARRRTGAMRRS